ncbi:type 1 glutamine amidotransferase [Chitinophaga sp. GCM10012297]|uniref:Gamma-glutamyl-gamma-aminobutyrate hydrolase family protein n=1 Tax=Chitinophaga chungangae TaxID=2821488 RepID=A0ABS3YK87_9BACT|nr:gamma-glutamyl-gamma-aminobutyrate hydrolase family protein [Chitinophaga chungangae]MBO9155098.1 gamma-glutamyl-gamma-aminobutyrate hydrolase family protein [Chitinophaga chungangae]
MNAAEDLASKGFNTTNMRIHHLQHVPFEGLAAIEDWAKQRSHTLTATRWYETDVLPRLEDFDMLVVMGGPMGIYDEADYPWLRDEKKFIRQSIDSGKPVLGVCLGSQLLADVLGAKVYPNRHKEIGWFPVQFHPELNNGELVVCHWHGDTFDLPEGAVRLAESAACKNQAYRYGDRVYGLQFHLETTPGSMEGMIAACGHELAKAEWVQTAEEMRNGLPYAEATRTVLFRLLDRLEKFV